MLNQANTLNIPFFNSKKYPVSRSFDLNDPVDRKLYFKERLGSKIEEIKTFLDDNTFIGYMLAKKQAGKSTYAKMFEEIVGFERFQHISVGDVIRNVHTEISSGVGRHSVEEYLEKNHRGFLSVEEAIKALENREHGALLPSELILTLVKMEIDKIGKKALFIDGLPRNLDQISYSLYFRALVNYRDDPDFFILIDVPEDLIDMRMKGRRVCNLCKTSKNTTLNPSKFVVYDEKTSEYLFLCDNESCKGYKKEVLVAKEGDQLGKESIRGRLDSEGELMGVANSLQGIPKVLIRNTISVEESGKYVDDFEISPSFRYEGKGEEVKIIREPLVVTGDDGVKCHSLSGACIVVSMVDQIHKILIG